MGCDGPSTTVGHDSPSLKECPYNAKKDRDWGGEGVHDKRYRYRYGHACEFTSALERPSLAGASDSEICVLVAHKLWELKKKN